ncbi:cobalamin B12-binding domain-containing protein [Ruegeria profundi]|nr:cobalamin B12-binding domain-containing protein [Ruegeria profundi]MCA0928523.1 cobalamin B12-binding domain-containing protein [Ruegeria profundi]
MPPVDPFEGSRPLNQNQLEAFAKRVLKSLDSHPQNPSSLNLGSITDWLYAHVISPVPFSFEETLCFLEETGVSSSEIIDVCIPEAACRAGQAWVDDEASFANVTLASSRLYAICKALSETWEMRPRRTGQPTILVVIAPGEQHMIGSVVAASQLRRMGCSVQLLGGATPKEAIACIKRGAFDAVLISCAGSQALDNAVHFITRIRSEIDQPPRLVIGGAIEKQVKLTSVSTGADLVTSDFEVALAGLTNARSSTEPLAAQ